MADESKALTIKGNQAGTVYVHTVDEALKLGETLVKSGFFTDVKTPDQAVVKILTGQELGFGPLASMVGVIIQMGRTSFSANFIASAIKRNGYDYNIIRLDADVCELEFVDKSGKPRTPHVVFSIKDAELAGLTTGKNAHSWKHYPKNMNFARAISNLAKWFTPDIFGGTTPYTPDELDIVVDGESGEVASNKAPVLQKSESSPKDTSAVTKVEAMTVAQPTASDASVEMVTLSDGKTQKPANEKISIKAIQSFEDSYVGKDKPFTAKAHLKNHLRKHFQVDTLPEMTWGKFMALVGHVRGTDDPKYYPQEEVKIESVSADDVQIRADSLGIDIKAVLGKLGKTVKTLTPEEVQAVLGLFVPVQDGLFNADDVDNLAAMLKEMMPNG